MLQFLLPNPTHHAIPLSLYYVQQIPAKVSNSSWFIHILPEFAFIIYFVNSSSLLSVSFLDYQTLEIIGWTFFMCTTQFIDNIAFVIYFYPDLCSSLFPLLLYTKNFRQYLLSDTIPWYSFMFLTTDE